MKKIIITIVSIILIVLIIAGLLSLNHNQNETKDRTVYISYSLSSSEAFDLVLSKVLYGDSEGKKVYVTSAPLQPNTVTSGDPYNPINSPDNLSWFFFIDDFPNANWSHPCRYVFVEMNKNITVVDTGWWPSYSILLEELELEEKEDVPFDNLSLLPVGGGFLTDLNHKTLTLTTNTIFPCCNYYISANTTIKGGVIVIDVERVVEPEIGLAALGSASYQTSFGDIIGSYKLRIEHDGIVYALFYLEITEEGAGFLKG